MNYKMIRNILGWLLLFEAGFMLIPLLTGICYGEAEIRYFAVTIFLCASIGLLFVWNKPQNPTLYAREGFVIVSLSWIVLSLFGAVPFFISGCIPNYVDAVFETVSGFTTTGASILTAVEPLPKCMLMWRSFTHWVGGMGVLVFIMAFVPLSGGQNMHIMKAESPGPSVSKLVPRVRTTALILYSIYLGLTLIQFILLLCGGLNAFEALCTAFGTAGTGGFGVLNDSMASYSPYVQWVVTVFMLLFSVNFSCYYLFLLGRIKEAFNAELRRFIVIVGAVILVITLNVRGLFDTLGEALRHVAFTVASLISTTGFATENFDAWPELSRTLLVLIMFIGACAGSTGGGLKVSRLMILFRGAFNEIGNLIHPRRVKRITIDGHPVEPEVVRATNVYMMWYVLLFTVSVILISFDDHDLVTNFTAVTATINNIGPGLNLVGPTGNFAFFSIPSKLVLIFDMLAGRLELFPMLVLFAPQTWKR
ncbi:MAG: TrkH family potassium uptake protein [Clostridia bacterium]|nr:TrkH family potassium uptake protein [Clostridia bacterium]